MRASLSASEGILSTGSKGSIRASGAADQIALKQAAIFDHATDRGRANHFMDAREVAPGDGTLHGGTSGEAEL